MLAARSPAGREDLKAHTTPPSAKPIVRLFRSVLVAPVLVCLALATIGVARAADTVPVEAKPVPLDPKQPARDRVGPLQFRGALILTSRDPRFGSFSDLHISADGSRLLAVSDRGYWLQATLTYDGDGRLKTLGGARMGALIDTDGKALPGRGGGAGDAEAMAVLPDGRIVVAFEGRHRIRIYPRAAPPFSKPPQRFPVPREIARAPRNGGVEALAHVGGGYFMILAERVRGGAGAQAGWVGADGNWEPFAYVRPPGFRPTALTLMPSGDILVLERHYTIRRGNAVRLALLRRRNIAPHRRLTPLEIARWAPPLTVENFEGASTRLGPDGETLIYLLSDDNRNPLQRTILMLFALE